MTKITIPHDSPDLGPNSDFQAKVFRKNRETVLSGLRGLPGIPEIVRTLNPDDVYKIVCSPEGGRLYADAAGNLKGVFYKDGKIIQHAKLQAIGPSFIKCATAVGSQILLIHIAIQLNRVQKGIHKIIEGLHDDRIAEIYSGVSQYNMAMRAQDAERQARLIEHAIQTVTTGIEKTSRSLKKQIEEMPKSESSYGDDWPFTGDRTKRAEEKFKPVMESFQACVIGIQTLAECYAVINEPQIAVEALKENMDKLSDCGIASAAKKARLVPFQERKGLPEQPFRVFLDSKRSLLDSLEGYGLLANDKFDCIEIEFKPSEVLEGEK